MTWQSLPRHRSWRGSTWTQTEDRLLSVRIGSDATMDPGFASQLNGTCSSDPDAFAFLAPSPVGFDNAFYRNL